MAIAEPYVQCCWRFTLGAVEYVWRAQLGRTPVSAEVWNLEPMFQHQKVDMVARSAKKCSWKKEG